jgi:hypothetical protein
MISKSKQNWEVGSNVKVGFMSLVVLAAVATPGDYAPDAYVLTNGKALYKFVPHNGISKLDAQEIKAAINEVKFN